MRAASANKNHVHGRLLADEAAHRSRQIAVFESIEERIDHDHACASLPTGAMPSTAGSRATTASRSPTTTTRRHMGFGDLRVINEDRVAPGSGFGTHGHRDMEIVSYVLDGELAHQDSMGTGTRARHGVIRPGDVQRMSAGTGVHAQRVQPRGGRARRTSCRSGSSPSRRGIAPGYEQKHFDADDKRGRLRLIASPDGARRLGDDPRGCLDRRRPVRRRRVAPSRRSTSTDWPTCTWRAASSSSTATRLGAGDAALLDGEAPLRTVAAVARPKCSCSTWPASDRPDFPFSSMELLT